MTILPVAHSGHDSSTRCDILPKVCTADTRWSPMSQWSRAEMVKIAQPLSHVEVVTMKHLPI